MTKPQKPCSRCNLLKDFEEFNFRSKSKNVRHAYSKECGKILTANHYKSNKQQYLDRNSRSHQKRREFIRQTKSIPCADCGVIYPYYVMDFDHREGEIKEYELNRTDRISANKLKKEIDKCDVVCSNCHRECTHQRRISKMKF